MVRLPHEGRARRGQDQGGQRMGAAAGAGRIPEHRPGGTDRRRRPGHYDRAGGVLDHEGGTPSRAAGVRTVQAPPYVPQRSGGRSVQRRRAGPAPRPSARQLFCAWFDDFMYYWLHTHTGRFHRRHGDNKSRPTTRCTYILPDRQGGASDVQQRGGTARDRRSPGPDGSGMGVPRGASTR